MRFLYVKICPIIKSICFIMYLLLLLLIMFFNIYVHIYVIAIMVHCWELNSDPMLKQWIFPIKRGHVSLQLNCTQMLQQVHCFNVYLMSIVTVYYRLFYIITGRNRYVYNKESILFVGVQQYFSEMLLVCTYDTWTTMRIQSIAMCWARVCETFKYDGENNFIMLK